MKWFRVHSTIPVFHFTEISRIHIPLFYGSYCIYFNSKRFMIRAGTTFTVLYMHSLVPSSLDYPVCSKPSAPQSKSCMILAGTTCTVLYIHALVPSSLDYPVCSQPSAPQSKCCIILAGTTCTVYAFTRTGQSVLPSVGSTYHVLCKKFSLEHRG